MTLIFVIGSSEFPSISDNARFVAFASTAPDMVPGDTSTADVFVRDTCLGATACTPSTLRASESLAGVGGDRGSGSPAISGDGRFVGFSSPALNLAAGPATTSHSHAYLRDTCAGATACSPSLTQLDVGIAGAEASAFILGRSIALSDSGRYAVFASSSTNLTTEATNSHFQLFWRDTCIGATACTPATRLVSLAIGGNGGASYSETAEITGSGRYVVFSSNASDLVAGDTNSQRDIFVRDLCVGASGCTSLTRRVSLAFNGAEPAAGVETERPPGISADGAIIAWASRADNLVSGDTNTRSDAFVVTAAP